MRYAVRLRWKTKEEGRKEPSVGEITQILHAESEEEVRTVALDWHKEQGFGGVPEIDSVDLIPGPA